LYGTMPKNKLRTYVVGFGDSTGAQELIELPNLNDPRQGGCADPRSGSGSASINQGFGASFRLDIENQVVVASF
jgi:hypothetical protein